MIPERLTALRREMKKRKMDLYLVPTADFHESEYVGEHFKARKFITGFTGSAGTAVITEDAAGLWTDGRYFVQAARQLEHTTVELYRMGQEGVPTVEEYIESVLPDGGVIGFDGRVVNGRWGDELRKIAEKKQGTLAVEEDLIDLIWDERPPMAKEAAWVLEEAYSGQSVADKLAAVRSVMEKKGADVHLLTSLCDIAWLLNVRGNDITYVPVVLSYLALTKEACIWFVQPEALDGKMRAYLEQNHIQTQPYGAFYEYVKTLENRKILLDRGVVNTRICSSLPASAEIIDEEDPTQMLKAVKNETEIANIRRAHVKDAVAMCRFMYWLKKNVGKIPMTEISVSDYLESLRRQQEGLLELSFDTICGYAAHGAIVHYSATPETDAAISPEGFLLVDSGGHYMEGTTDITRTFALGSVTDEMKTDYTLVCRANLRLANAQFMSGCTGMNLDVLARAPLWEAHKDYNHGTGHGVGYLLNVHEGPNGVRSKGTKRRPGGAAFEPGMVTTDEPGIYIEGKYGIRLENELLCQKGEKNDFGQFLCFENLTYVPFDLDAIDAAQMTDAELSLLNAYHARVYEVVSPYLAGDELEWLGRATAAAERNGRHE